MFLIYLLSTALCGTIIPEFYHTTEQIDEEVKNILENCRMKASIKDHGEIYSITLKPKDFNTKNKAFIIFGEHAREMISVETGLYFLQKVCSEGLNVKLKMIINMNPGSRKYVEKGHYCLRENLNGVDLNRNYGFQWKYKEDHFQQDSSGPEPFSEIATQTVRDILLSFNPRTFITVHSGTLAILHPWAYKQEEVVIKHNNLRRMKKECEHCLIGGAATQIGYTASGNSMDYAYGEAKVKRSYTIEMFEVGQKKKEPESNFAEFLQNKHRTDLGTDQLFCFHYFNPITEEAYNNSLQSWTNIILELIE